MQKTQARCLCYINCDTTAKAGIREFGIYDYLPILVGMLNRIGQFELLPNNTQQFIFTEKWVCLVISHFSRLNATFQ